MIKADPIISLDQHSDLVAAEIYRLFQRSYQKEAELIGRVDFPPLNRSSEQIKQSNTRFLGCRQENTLAAVIEMELQGAQLEIHSLVVDPDYFRQGHAMRFIEYVLFSNSWERSSVETAEQNLPAIRLYKKLGFTEEKKWTTAEGINKIQLGMVKLKE
jgi:ribosomal protein S18 acetylase RimI-like enzyme